MSYSVDWTGDALAALTAVWIHSSNRQSVTLAQASLDQILSADPFGRGKAVSEGLYAIEIHPLRVQFEVSEIERIVTVVSVRQLP
jgi:hypothetical protein